MCWELDVRLVSFIFTLVMLQDWVQTSNGELDELEVPRCYWVPWLHLGVRQEQLAMLRNKGAFKIIRDFVMVWSNKYSINRLMLNMIPSSLFDLSVQSYTESCWVLDCKTVSVDCKTVRVDSTLWCEWCDSLGDWEGITSQVLQQVATSPRPSSSAIKTPL